MTPVEIVQAAMGDGVRVTLSPTGTIKAIGEQSAVNRWCSILRENKAEIIRHLTGGTYQATVPEPCRECARLEIIEGVGAGCVKTLPASSPWQEEWRRTPTDLTVCKQKQTIVMATGHDCGKCGANDYQQTADGWRDCGCGMVFTWIGGSAGPVVIH